MSEFNCHGHNLTVQVHEVTNLIDDYHLRSEMHFIYSPAFHGTRERVVVQGDTYVGSCPLELKPGDEKLQTGEVRRHTWKQ
jgi:hypothetical protein